MNRPAGRPWHARCVALGAFSIFLSMFSTLASSQEIRVSLSGSQEIPPVSTPASGTGTLTVDAERNMTGSVTISGMTPTVAHIHEAPAGGNGPIIVPLLRTADNVWSVPPGTRLSEAQYKSFRAGNLYFNIHSDAHRSGEIRGQIKP